MRHFIYFLIVFSFFLASCGKGYEKYITKNIGVNIGFEYRSTNSGVFTDNVTGNEYLYFADPTTQKRIKIFDLEGHLKQNILIGKETFEYLNDIDRVSVIALDTIILNSRYTNKICAINSRGKCWYRLDLKGKLFDSIGNVYELTASMQNVNQTEKCLTFGLEYRNNINDKPDTTETPLHELKRYYQNSIKAAYFVKITNPFVQPKPIFFLYDFYKEVSKDEIAPTELSNVYIGNRRFVLSNYSSYIYELNQLGTEIENRHLVTSSYTRINFTPYSYSKDTNVGLQDYITLNAKHRGMISKILENNNNKIMLTVFQDIENTRHDRPYSVIVLDSKFKKQNEILFKDGVYGSPISTSEGILMRKFNNKKSKHEELEFSFFDFH